MSSLRIAVFQVILGVAFAVALTAPAAGQSCAHRWDIEFGASGANGRVWDLEEYDDGTGPALYAAGWFTEMQGKRAWGIAKWDGRDWSEVGGGLSIIGREGGANSLYVWDDGRGPALYVGGHFQFAGNIRAQSVARWDGRNWEPLGAGVSRSVFSFCDFDDGRGDALYVGGTFDQAGGAGARHVARWDGSRWEALGGGFWGGTGLGVCTMAVFDDGFGSMLYVGGEVYAIDYPAPQAAPAYLLARWNGQAWLPVPGAMFSNRGTGSHVDQILVHDDGNGPALFVAGQFAREGTGEYLLRWDGTEWSALGGGIRSGQNFHGDGMCVYDDGTGPALWIGGGEVWINDLGRTSSIYQWDGQSLSVPEGHVDLSFWVYTLASHNDGFGQALYAGGELWRANGQSIRNITRWSPPHMALSHSPLRAGQRAAFATTCSTPGQRVNFLYSARGLGSVFIPRLGISIDLDTPHLIGHSIADPGGKAGLSRAIPPDASGRTLWLQAAEVGRKTEVVESIIE
ncbi:MAG: hypothetical protein KJZ69_17210 [Phycisphaerales bacterium]|nr:hypothetical protein [Phycisphaerales bacterium]